MAIKPDALYSCLVQDLHESEIPFRDSLSSCTSASEASVFLMKESFLKKFEEYDPIMRSTADSVALSKFLSVNDRCGTWRSDKRDTLYLDCLIGYFRDEVHRFFNPRNREPLVSTYEQILQFARCGPGVSIGSEGNDFYTKLFSSDLCYTSRILEISYLNYFSSSPLWADAESFRRSEGFGERVVPGNRLTTVPKNVDTSRVIAIEPNLNIFFQLGLAAILTDRLKVVYGIDLSKQQSVNRELARIGSLDDRLCTIDLESASDSMPWPMIKAYFPSDLVRMLGHLRSPMTLLPDGRQVALHMISTMGNGFTFPLQTIVFCCAVSACYRYLGRGFCRSGLDWSVFGDDIIVPNHLVGPVIHLIEHLGFQVNTQKSFLEGPFRESCGHDYFRGRNVRAVYVKRLSVLQTRCAIINQLNYWSARTGIRLSRTVKFLLKTVPDFPVPPWDNDDAGIKVPYDLVRNKKVHPEFQSIMYRRFSSKPNVMRFGDGVVLTPRGSRKRIYNPSAIFLAALDGSLVSGKINIRHDVKLYRSRQAIAPNWERSPTDSDIASEDLRQRWDTAVRFNLL